MFINDFIKSKSFKPAQYNGYNINTISAHTCFGLLPLAKSQDGTWRVCVAARQDSAWHSVLLGSSEEELKEMNEDDASEWSLSLYLYDFKITLMEKLVQKIQTFISC